MRFNEIRLRRKLKLRALLESLETCYATTATTTQEVLVISVA